MCLKVKVTSFGRAAFQLFNPLTFNSPGHWATLGNYRSCLPVETISFPVCLQPTYDAKEYQTCTDTVTTGPTRPRVYVNFN